uniref:Uncharacterized protein n=1 Tax=Picea sitchensis TaxID=3332 RepID=A0A6B9XTN5_PICSI|nr:hypothetical protein Q903MT_gene5467 [Picea sitchensis]
MCIKPLKWRFSRGFSPLSPSLMDEPYRAYLLYFLLSKTPMLIPSPISLAGSFNEVSACFAKTH